MTVWTIEDEKYGLQAIFSSKAAADKALDTGKYDVSGYGSQVFEWEVED